MAESFVIGIDSSTGATKAVAFDCAGRTLGEGRAPIPMANPGPSRYEQDPQDWQAAMISSLKALGSSVDLAAVAAVAISNQRETIAFLDARGKAVRPAMVWLDERCRSEVEPFAALVGREKILSLTGKHPDVTPVCYRLAWCAKNEPEVMAKTEFFADVQATLVWFLTGACVTSWASADPMGYFAMRQRCWASEVITELGISAERLPELRRPCSLLGQVGREAAALTGLPVGLPVVAGGGDGQCAAMAVGATVPGSAYLNLGTAVVGGSWHAEYAFDRAWRTMISMTGEGYIMEVCLRSGTFMLDWLMRDVFGLANSAADHKRLQAEAATLPPGADGLLLLPYWMGVMMPHWDNAARGTITGLSTRHGRAHLYRALLEGIALEQAMCFALMEERIRSPIDQISLVGGGANSDLWAQIFADATGRECRRLATVEASALGAAMAAAVGIGWFADGTAAAMAMGAPTAASFSPGPDAQAYVAILERYRELYPATTKLSRMVD